MPAQTARFAGRWIIDVTFDDGSRHSLRFDAAAAGTGSLLIQDSRSSLAEPARPSAGRWTERGGNVTFSGAVEFPVGNVGRDAGTLVMKGAIRQDAISGDASFFPEGQNPDDPHAVASKKGTFTAARSAHDF